MKIIPFYEAVLKALGCDIDGSVVLLPNTDNPVKIGERELVLPTNDRLSTNDWEEVVGFHPVCESVTSQQSEVFKWVMKMVKASMVEKSLSLAEAFLKLAASEGKKKSTYAKYIAKFEGIDKNTYGEFEKLTDKMGRKFKGLDKAATITPMELVRVFVDRNEYVESERFLRVLYYTSPIFDPEVDDSNLFGVHLRSKASKKAIVALLKDIMLCEEKTIGCNDDAPNFTVLMNLYVEFCKKYNSLCAMIAKDIELPKVDLEFAEHLELVPKYRNRIPPLSGNTGSDSKPKEDEDTDDTPPFDVEEVQRESRRPAGRTSVAPRESTEEATGLNFFSGGDDSHHDDEPRSTGDPRASRLTNARRSRRDEDRADSWHTRRDRDDRDDDRFSSRDRDSRRGSILGGSSRRDSGSLRKNASRFGR